MFPSMRIISELRDYFILPNNFELDERTFLPASTSELENEIAGMYNTCESCGPKKVHTCRRGKGKQLD